MIPFSHRTRVYPSSAAAESRIRGRIKETLYGWYSPARRSTGCRPRSRLGAAVVDTSLNVSTPVLIGRALVFLPRLRKPAR
jgi:hypothetical protein